MPLLCSVYTVTAEEAPVLRCWMSDVKPPMNAAEEPCFLAPQSPWESGPRIFQAVAELGGVDVLEDVLVQQSQAVADAEVVFVKRKLPLLFHLQRCDREVCPAEFLSFEDVDDRIDRFELEVEVGVGLEFHRNYLSDKQLEQAPSAEGWQFLRICAVSSKKCACNARQYAIYFIRI